MLRVLTSFTKFTTAEGQRISYTWSEIEDDGSVISQNNKANFVATDPELLLALATVDERITERLAQ